MASYSAPKDQKVENPVGEFDSPSQVVKDKDLSRKQKEKALETWEQDAHQLLTASNEGMTGSDKGFTRNDRDQLGPVVRAKDELSETPKHKPPK